MMLRNEGRVLARPSPPEGEGRRDRAENESDQESSQQNAHGSRPEDLVAELVRQGCVVTTALVGPGVRTPRSKDAIRKKDKREEMKGEWCQLNVWAPDNPPARAFLMIAAKEIESKRVLKALRSALENPGLVRIGQKVLKLRGKPGAQVRRALGL